MTALQVLQEDVDCHTDMGAKQRQEDQGTGPEEREKNFTTKLPRTTPGTGLASASPV